MILPTKPRQKKPSRELIQAAILETWERGRLYYLLHSGQRVIDRELCESKGQLFVGNIARQFGKSYWAVCKATEQCLKKPKSRVKYATAFQSDLTEFILPTFDAVLAHCPEHLKPVYKVQGSKWVFANGSEIKLVGLDKSPNSLRGNVIDLIVIDEAGFVTNLEYIYKSIIVPATTHRPHCKIIFISTPPSTPAHPFGDFIQLAEAKGSYTMLTVFDNPMLNEADIDRLAEAVGGRNSTTFRREFLCELILDDNLALCAEWDEKWVQEVKRDECFQYYYKLVGQDLGRVDHTALIFGYYDFKRAALVIEDELTMSGPEWTTKTLKTDVRRREWTLWGDGTPYVEKDEKIKETQAAPVFRRVSDNNNPHLLKDLSSIHGIHFMAVMKESSLEQMVNRVREWVKQGRILIHPRCTHLIGCMKYGIWDKNRKEFSRSKVYGHFDHFAALMYLLIHTPSNSNPIPADHGFESHRAWLGHVKGRQSPNAEVFKKILGPGKPK